MSTAQWANIGADAGALYALLGRVAEHVPVPLIHDLWIFPPRRIAIGESIVIVVGAQGETDQRRRVLTAHFTIARNRKGVPTVTARFAEHGTAPIGAMPRIVQGVLRRLGEDSDAAPREEAIAGATERWDALVMELGGRPATPEPAAPEPGAAAPEPTGAPVAGSAAAEPTAAPEPDSAAVEPAAAPESGDAPPLAGSGATSDGATPVPPEPPVASSPTRPAAVAAQAPDY